MFAHVARERYRRRLRNAGAERCSLMRRQSRFWRYVRRQPTLEISVSEEQMMKFFKTNGQPMPASIVDMALRVRGPRRRRITA